MGIPTPLMVDVDELERIHAGLAASGKSAAEPTTPVSSASVSPPPSSAKQKAIRQVDVPTVRRPKVRPPSSPADKLETIATRPLETPVRSPERRTPSEPSGGGRGRWIGALALTAVAAGGFYVWRSRDLPGHGKDGRPEVSATPTAPATASQHVEASAATGSAVPAPPPSSPAAPASRPSPNPSTAATASSSAAVAQGKASVSLLGDPGTRVWVDGTARGSCPAKLTLDAGPHEVRFTFDPTGESRVERFTLKGGDHVTVRADFTGASPTVTIQR